MADSGMPVGPGFVGARRVQVPHRAKPSDFMVGLGAGATLALGLGMGPWGVAVCALVGLMLVALDEDDYRAVMQLEWTGVQHPAR